MKSLVLTLAGIMLSFSMFAQTSEEVITTDQVETAVVTEDADPLNHKVFYRNKSMMALNVSNSVGWRNGTVTPPVKVGIEITAFKNFTIGPVLTFFQQKHTVKLAEDITQVTDFNIRYNNFTFGMKGSYHLMPLIQKITGKPMLIDYVDVYVTGWVGYSMLFTGDRRADSDYLNEQSTVRGGAGIGVRSMVLPRFGFFVEGGYSSFSYGTFGITTVLK